MQNEMKSPKAGRVVEAEERSAGRYGGRRRSSDGDRIVPDPKCPHCGGTGWKIVERDGLSGAARCDCATVHRPEATNRQRSYPAELRTRVAWITSFCRRIIRLARTGLGMALRQAIGFARDFPAVTPPGLVIDRRSGNRQNASGRRRHEGAARIKVTSACSSIIRTCSTGSAPATTQASGTSDREAYRDGARCRCSDARRSGRASRHRMGGGHRDVDHHVSLQS